MSKKLIKNVLNPRFYEKNKLIFLNSTHQPMGKFCHMATSRCSSKNIEKINKYWLSNIELVLIHMVLKFGVLSIAGKLLVPSITSKKIQIKFKIYSS